jgi:DNA-binding NarL/FixJ family response regulator
MRGPQVALSSRELEVMSLVAVGLSNIQIGAKLGISPRTVQAHLRSVFGRLQVANRLEAVSVLIEQGSLACPASRRVRTLVLWWLAKGPTPMQAQVFALKAQGHSMSAIASKLFLYTGVVRHHLVELYRGLGLERQGGSRDQTGAFVAAIAAWSAPFPRFSEFGGAAIRTAAVVLAWPRAQTRARWPRRITVDDILIARAIAETADLFRIGQTEAREILFELGRLL